MFLKKTPHNVFNYQPIFYDEKKERREKSKKESEENKKSEYTPKIRGEFRRQFQHTAQKKQRSSNMRLLFLIAFFGFIAYYLLIHKDMISYMLNYLIPEQP
jgi:hypothetical protein